jgi:hypothetical protein
LIVGAIVIALSAWTYIKISKAYGPTTGAALLMSRFIAVWVVVHLLAAFTLGSHLPFDQIIAAKNHILAEAARLALGQTRFYLKVALVKVATASGLSASVIAASSMLTMLTEMKTVRHSQFGISGTVKDHTLVFIAL